MQQLKRMGPLTKVMEMIPGMGKMTGNADLSGAEGELKRIEAIIRSMTPRERHNTRIIKASRKRRIAAGSGTTVQEVNALLRQFKQMQRMMKQLKSGRGRNLASMLGGRM
jgi:signal recognition particle subunit SRP54